MEKKTVFIVDDEEGFPRMAKLFLEQSGDYHVEYELDSTAALEKAREIKPDVILLDLIMPEKDGAELKADMEADPFLGSIPKLFITSNVSQDDTAEGGLVETGDGLMLPKTSPPDLVVRSIEELLAGNL